MGRRKEFVDFFFNKANKKPGGPLWQKRKDNYIRALKIVGSHCSQCGAQYPPCAMDFFHTDPKTRSFSLAGAGLERKWIDIEAELAKCELLCAVCSRIRRSKTDWRKSTDIYSEV